MTPDPRHPSAEWLRQIDIHLLLPQQVPFVMVGRLTTFDELNTATETSIAVDNLFVEDDVLSAPGLLENIAQTCAARIGYVNRYILGRGIQIGYIGAVRDFSIHRLPHVGETISTRISVVGQVAGMTLAQASVMAGSETLATTEMKIAIKDQD